MKIQVVLYLVSCLASILLLSSVLPIIAWTQLTLVGSGVGWAGSKYRSNYKNNSTFKWKLNVILQRSACGGGQLR